MDSVGVNLIKTAALGRPFELGMLYDCRTDELIAGIRLWNKEQLEQNTCSRSQINTNFTVTASDTVKDKSNLLNIEGGLNLSVLGGLVQVSGAAKYLKDTKTSFIQERLTLHYHSTSEFKELTVNQLPPENIPDDDNDIATHVVTGILYGANACFVFDRHVSSDEDKKIVKGEVKAALEKLGVISVDAHAELNMNESEKSAFKNFTCTFYGDFQLPSNPTSFEDAMKIFADLPKLLKENQKLAVPLRVWLYPLNKLNSRASKVQKDISMDLIQKTESVIESLNTAEMRCSDLLEDSPAAAFDAFHDKILQMKQNSYMYKLIVMKKLGSLLPNIRGDRTKETELNDLLQEHHESPFNESDLKEWLKERERESKIIKTVLRQLKNCGAEVEASTDAILMDLEVVNLVSYTFTSLNCSDMILPKQEVYLSSSTKRENVEISTDIKQKSWLSPETQKTMRRNLEIFKNLIDSKDRKPAKFIVSSKEMMNNPGSCILLYESECDEAVCFTPPSRPAIPVTEEVKGQSVVLKMVPLSCPATVELRLLYKEKQDSVWRSEPVLKDQDTVTLTDLREETEHEIKCAAVGKLNYTTESDVITVKTGRNMRHSAGRDRKAMASDISKTFQSLTTAEDMRNQTKLMMQPYANWEEYLTPAPLFIAIMGELVFISSSTDFSINKNSPIDGYQFIKYPDSFRACLLQVCNSGCLVFNEAHTNMDQIRLHTAQVLDYVKIAVKILFQGNDEVVQAHLPDQLHKIRVIADECLKLSDATEKCFSDGITIIKELLEACVNAEHFYGEEKEKIKMKLEESKLREMSAKEAKKRTERRDHESYKTVEYLYGWKMTENEKELTEILVTMRNCELKEIDFNTTIKMLVKELDAMCRVKVQWEKMGHFFQMVSNIVKTSLSTTLKNFVSTSEKTQALSYNAKLFSKYLLYTQAFQACNIASLVNTISGTYTDVSNKYLMDCVSSLGKLMAMDKSKPEFERERHLLHISCDEAQKGILNLVLKNKGEFERKSTARLEMIDQELLAILPAAPPEQVKRIQDIVQSGFSEEDEASYY